MSGNGKTQPGGKVPGREAQTLPKRFYERVAVAERGAGFAILLDGRPVRTPAKLVLVVPTRALADALAAEWDAQVETIDPATMPLTRHVNTTRDGIEGREAEIRADIVNFAGSDLLCYRAESPAGLVAAQARAWDPLLAWARTALGSHFKVATGLMPIEQPPEALAGIAAALEARSAFELAGMHTMTSLTGSAIIALAVVHGITTPEAAWDAAHVDEDWQIAQWGEDGEARARRDRRWVEMAAAGRLVKLLASRA